ncbi:MAG: peptide deformylase [Oscillospiraceae bacterium]
MAIRKIMINGEEILTKKCKTVENFDQKLWTLLDDMKETLANQNGVGLAAPQVGVIRRAVIVDDGDEVLELINPSVSDFSGTQRDAEGCLSCPGVYGYVTRPLNCKVHAQDRYGNYFEKEMSEMACRCACHEVDHLDGKLFLELVEEFVDVEED